MPAGMLSMPGGALGMGGGGAGGLAEDAGLAARAGGEALEAWGAGVSISLDKAQLEAKETTTNTGQRLERKERAISKTGFG